MESPAFVIMHRDTILAPARSGGIPHTYKPVHPDMLVLAGDMTTWRTEGTSLFGWRKGNYERGLDADWIGSMTLAVSDAEMYLHIQ